MSYKIYQTKDAFIIFEPETVQKLRDLHIIGNSIDPYVPQKIKRKKKSNNSSKIFVPVCLFREQAELLDKRFKDTITIIEYPSPQKNEKSLFQNLQCKVFEDLWLKNLYITPGLKFGTDFLGYLGDPEFYHSSFIILCYQNIKNTLENDIQNILCLESILDFIILARLATSVKKMFILAYEKQKVDNEYQDANLKTNMEEIDQNMTKYLCFEWINI
ncbi:unnamed protein product [Gordionus sp. m RMFG-2023]